MENENVSAIEGRKRMQLGWSAVLGAGVIASVVFQLLEAVLIPLAGGGVPWGPARMIAAMAMGPDVLAPGAKFELKIVAVALLVDLALAIAYTAVLSVFIRGWPLGRAIFVGAVFGAVIYLINFYGFTTVFPWFEMGRNWVTLFTHIAFSVTAVMAYKNLYGRSTLVRTG
jgi:hypothetical protein